MNKMYIKNFTRTILAGFLLIFAATGCERSVDGLKEPEFPSNPDVFIDSFSSGLEYYPFEGSRPDAFSVDGEDTYDNSGASMRFDVPNEGDPAGSYAGAIFRDENGGRNLTSYNALTFYAKGTKAGTINEIGFGRDFYGDEYAVTLNNLKLTTNWEQYIVPIPDASLLTSQQGMFWYAEGPEDGDGYSFWVDEVKFENISTLAQARPAIQNGNEETQTSFIGSTIQLQGLNFTINQANGVDITVGTSPAYFTFASSNEGVATVNDNGTVSVVGQGTAEITATLGGEQANGSLTIESIDYTSAPTPTQSPEDVISIFSDAYENVPVDFYNGFYEPFQTTTSNDFTVNGDNVLSYENFNFVGIEFNQNVPTIDGSEMDYLTMDVYLPDNVPTNSALTVNLVDFGADESFAGGDDTEVSTTINSSSIPALVSGQWINISLDISGMANKSNLGQIVLDSDAGPALNGATIYVDNIYLYKDGSSGGASGLELPVTFEDESLDYALTDFGGNASDLVQDPDNAANTVARSIKTGSAELWAGTTVGGSSGFGTAIPFTSTETTMSVRVWSPTAGTPVRLKVEDSADGNISVETEATTTVAGAWETLVFDFSNEAAGTPALNLSNTYNKASIFFNFGTSGADAGEQTYYWDDMDFGGGN